MPADSYCPPDSLLVRDRDGGTWSFPSGCLLDGFTHVNGTERDPFKSFDYCERPSRPTRPCLELDTSTCSKDARCLVLRGIQYDPLRHCRLPGYAEIGCADATNGCSSVVTHASYADERVPSFQFPSGCIPSKFVSTPAGGESVDAWPVCPEAAASAHDQ
jgi:hypothetical protein